MDALTLAGERAAAEMERLWALDIIDPKPSDKVYNLKHPRAADSLVEINRIIKRNGWGWTGVYKRNGQPQWCGMTAGDAWATAGMDPSMLEAWWASTDRLYAWANYDHFNANRNIKRPGALADQRMLARIRRGAALTFTPRRGDVIIVGDGRRATGDHVTVLVSYDPVRRVFDTISGNGGGVGPTGDRREGVSRKSYAVDAMATDRDPMFAIRPGFGDLLAERA